MVAKLQCELNQYREQKGNGEMMMEEDEDVTTHKSSLVSIYILVRISHLCMYVCDYSQLCDPLEGHQQTMDVTPAHEEK